jgi:VWFA-related protein
MLLFDLTNTTPASLKRAHDAAEQFVSRQTVPSDLLAVATISVQSGAQLLSSFTTDRSLALAAVKSIGGPVQMNVKDPLLLTAAEFDRAAEAAGGRLAAEVAEHYKQLATTARLRSNEERKATITRSLDHFAELGRLLDRVKGRKQVVLLSEGFDAKMLHGREQISSEDAGREMRAVEMGQVWNVDTDSRYGNTTAAKTLQRMIDALRRSDVVLHAVDIKGVRSEVDASEGVQRVSNESLFLLTHDTGGTVFKNTNDLSEDFKRMLAEQEVTYVLAFQAPARTSGKFHPLKVRLVDVPNARVIHRPGYYEASVEATGLDRTLTAGEIIMNRLPVSDVRIDAVAAPFPAADGKADVPVVVEIDGQTLLRGIKDRNAATEIFIYAFDAKSDIRDFVYQNINLDLGKLRDRINQRGVKFYNTLRLEPGDYSIRTLVRSNAGKYGFRETAVHVPAASEPFVSSVFMDTSDEWVMVKAPDRAGAGAYPFMAGENMFVPAAAPVLSAGKTAEIALVGYNMPNFDLAAKIGSETLPLKMLGRTEPRPDGRVIWVLHMTPPALPRGEHALVMELRGTGKTVSTPVRVE